MGEDIALPMRNLCLFCHFYFVEICYFNSPFICLFCSRYRLFKSRTLSVHYLMIFAVNLRKLFNSSVLSNFIKSRYEGPFVLEVEKLLTVNVHSMLFGNLRKDIGWEVMLFVIESHSLLRSESSLSYLPALLKFFSFWWNIFIHLMT